LWAGPRRTVRSKLADFPAAMDRSLSSRHDLLMAAGSFFCAYAGALMRVLRRCNQPFCVGRHSNRNTAVRSFPNWFSPRRRVASPAGYFFVCCRLALKKRPRPSGRGKSGKPPDDVATSSCVVTRTVNRSRGTGSRRSRLANRPSRLRLIIIPRTPAHRSGR